MDGRVPVTLFAGFLGAGKTTLVNRVLRGARRERFAVVVNEFGDVGIDGRLVVRADEDVVELANGCLCCTVRGDLVEAIGGLLDRRLRRFRATPFERLLVEASGLASPGPVLQTLLVEPRLAAETRAAGVVVVVNAARLEEDLAAHPEVAEQLAHASLVLLNHADRADAARLERAEAEVRRANPLARVHRSVRADVPLDELFREEPASASAPPAAPSVAHAHASGGAVSVVLRADAPLGLHRLKMWLAFLSGRRGQDLWRMKGVVRCTEAESEVVVHSVHEYLELGPGPGPPPAESVLVVIGRGLDAAELERGWRACVAGA